MLTFSYPFIPRSFSQGDQNTLKKKDHDRPALLKYLNIWNVCKLPKCKIVS